MIDFLRTAGVTVRPGPGMQIGHACQDQTFRSSPWQEHRELTEAAGCLPTEEQQPREQNITMETEGIRGQHEAARFPLLMRSRKPQASTRRKGGVKSERLHILSESMKWSQQAMLDWFNAVFLLYYPGFPGFWGRLVLENEEDTFPLQWGSICYSASFY